jgi:hypothetical protein
MIKLNIGIVLISFVLIISPPTALQGKDYIIYANEYDSSHDISLEPITKQDYSITGLDYPGEWVEYSFFPDEFGTNASVIVVRGTAGIAFSLELTLISGLVGEEQTTLFEFIGNGFSG